MCLFLLGIPSSPDHDGLPTISHSHLPRLDHLRIPFTLRALLLFGSLLLSNRLPRSPCFLSFLPFLVALFALHQLGLVLFTFPLAVAQLLAVPAPQAILAGVSIVPLAECIFRCGVADLLVSLAIFALLRSKRSIGQVGVHAIDKLADL